MRIEPVKPPERPLDLELHLDLSIPEIDFELVPQKTFSTPSSAEVSEALRRFNVQMQREEPATPNTEPPKRHRDEEVKPEIGGLIW